MGSDSSRVWFRREGPSIVKRFTPEEPLRCSFCHKSQEQVEKLISSPSEYPRSYICNECVGVCQQILEDEKREQASPANRRSLLALLILKNLLANAHALVANVRARIFRRRADQLLDLLL